MILKLVCNRVVNNIYRNGLKVFVKFWAMDKILLSYYVFPSLIKVRNFIQD